ncbi:unnamed protein product [Amoebophrya sp. A25]|nr:unnamed protein product [Amoebophrya sp. A25]|eukprot:GSA25T00012457001.1
MITMMIRVLFFLGISVLTRLVVANATGGREEPAALSAQQNALLCELRNALRGNEARAVDGPPFFYTQSAFDAVQQADFGRRPPELFRLLPVDVPPALLPGRHSSCAVVGSSGILTPSSAADEGGYFGREIDGHDVVFRLNGAPAGNKGDDNELLARIAGTRTDIRVMNGWHVSESKPYVYGVDAREDEEEMRQVQTNSERDASSSDTTSSPPVVDQKASRTSSSDAPLPLVQKASRKEIVGEELLHWRSRYAVGDLLVGALPMRIYADNGFDGSADLWKFIYWQKYLGIRAKDMRDYEYSSMLRHVRTDARGGVGNADQIIYVQGEQAEELRRRRRRRRRQQQRQMESSRSFARSDTKTASAKTPRSSRTRWGPVHFPQTRAYAKLVGEKHAGGKRKGNVNGVAQESDLENMRVTEAAANSKVPWKVLNSEAMEYLVDHTAVRPNSLPYYLLTPTLLTGLQKFLNDFKASGPSTGSIGIALALHLCDSVTLYGFESGDVDQEKSTGDVDQVEQSMRVGAMNNIKAHYWDRGFDLQRRTEMHAAHPISSEQKRWSELKFKSSNSTTRTRSTRKMTLPGISRAKSCPR